MHIPTFSRRFTLALIVLTVVACIGAMFAFTQKERARDMQAWQDKLNLIADTGAGNVSQWVEAQFRELSTLANNASLQLYFSTLNTQGAPRSDAVPPAQADYLRNMLTLTAERLGYQSTGPAIEMQVRANVRRLGGGGLALVNNDGVQMMATSGMPPIEGALLESIKKAPRGQTSLIDITESQDGSQRMGFVVPVYSIQADHSAASQIGTLVGVRTLSAPFYAMLSTPRSKTEKTLEVALVRMDGDQARYLTPLLDASPTMSRREENAPAKQAGAFAMKHPGDFGTRMDYRGQDVLVTGREIPGTPWTLVAKIDRNEALTESVAWRRTILAIFLLMTCAVTATILAVWRHAGARRMAVESLEAQTLAAASEARAKLLTLVTDHQPEPLYIVDESQTVCFANQAAAASMQSTPEDIRGKKLASAAGNAVAQAIEPYCAEVLATNETKTAMLDQGDRHIRMSFVPLARIPVEGMSPDSRGILVTEQDMTDAISEREKRMHTLSQLVAMLVSLIDRRDPHAAEHSAYVTTVARHTARAMNLDETMIATTEIAAQLMNLGKMNVPAEMLVRKGGLNPQEQETVRQSLATSAAMLVGIDFEGPVAETLRQAQEYMDGSGPLKLKGDAILVSARIIAAANALIGMLSARSYRKPISMDDAIKTLFGQIDTQFDRKVIVAMIHYLDNQGGRENLHALQSTLPKAA